MIELLVGALVGVVFGAQHGWPMGASAGAGAVLVGPLLYVASCLYWQEWPCWWPWCTARRAVAKGPGKRRRRRRPCWRCGGSGYILRWGTRLRRR